jgi:hypothetical protein
MAEESSQLVQASLIRADGETILVEWTDEKGLLRRGFVPAKAFTGEGVTQKSLDRATPYGVPFERLVKITISISPEAIAEELRRAGIWTLDDLRQHFRVALGAFQKGLVLDIAALMRAAEDYQKTGGK